MSFLRLISSCLIALTRSSNSSEAGSLYMFTISGISGIVEVAAAAAAAVAARDVSMDFL